MARFSAYPLYFCCSLKNKTFLSNELYMQHPNPYSVRMYFQLFITVFIMFFHLQETSREARTIILTLAVCYHARIQERKQFEKDICSKFEPPISQSPISREKFVKEISRYVSV